MVSRFRRTLSIPNPICNNRHTRSTSLPCSSHPLISQLKDEINELKISQSNHEIRTSSWLYQNLIILKNVHNLFEDLLHLSQTQDSLYRKSDLIEKLLEDYLKFIDIYGIFRASIVSIKEKLLSLRVAIRRKDESKIDSFMKSRKKMDKEMMKLVSTVRSIGRYSVPGSMSVSDGSDGELAGLLRDVNEVTVSVTICLIKGISSSVVPKSKLMSSCKMWKKKDEKEEGIREVVEVMESLIELKKGDEGKRIRVLERLEDLEKCIEEIESGSEQVFRSLINTRVCLLNIVT